MLCIADHANKDGVCWPSVHRLAQETHVCDRQVRRLLRTLEAKGCIVVDQRRGRGRASIIRIALSERETKEDIGVPESAGKADTRVPFNVAKADTAAPFTTPIADASVPLTTAQNRTTAVANDAENRTFRARKPDIPPHTRVEPIKNLQNTLNSECDGTQTANSQQTATNPSPQQRKFDVLCWIVGWDHQNLTQDERGQIAHTLATLKRSGYGEEDLRAFWSRVWINDWRWKRNHSRPTLKQVRLEILRVRAGENPPGACVTARNVNQLSEEDLALQREMLEARKREPCRSLEELAERLQLSSMQGHAVASP